jgi:hypothetical protein
MHAWKHVLARRFLRSRVTITVLTLVASELENIFTFPAIETILAPNTSDFAGVEDCYRLNPPKLSLARVQTLRNGVPQ